MRLPLAIAALACAAAPLAAATPPPVRQPTAKWVLEYADTHCTAFRSYGTAEAPLTFALRPSPNGTTVRLMVARAGRMGMPHHFPVTVGITSEPVRTTGLVFETRDRKKKIIWINVARAALEGLRSVDTIAVRGKGEIDERFGVPGIGAVLTELDRCIADLRRHWNIEGASAAGPAQPARSLKPLHNLVFDSDYPDQAMRENASGTTGMMLLVDQAGTLKDCMVEEASGIATLDAMACGILLERAKFKPALDAAGKPVRSVQHARVRWVMP